MAQIIFFLEPNRAMREDDLKLLRRLHDLAPIIPVIGKSDTLTMKEKEVALAAITATRRPRPVIATHVSQTSGNVGNMEATAITVGNMEACAFTGVWPARQLRVHDLVCESAHRI